MLTPSDVLIIGASYAGLAAAHTLYRHGHTVTIFDAGIPIFTTSTALRLVPGFDGSSGDVLHAASRKELSLLANTLVHFEDGVTIAQATRTTYEDQPVFSVTDTTGRVFLGRTLLLATGRIDSQPPELRGAEVAALWARDGMASPMHAAMLAGDALKIAHRAIILTDGHDEIEGGVRAIISSMPWARNVEFENRSVANLRLVREGLKQKIGISLGEENKEKQEVMFDFLVHQPVKRQAIPHILEELGVECDAKGDIKTVNPFCGTTATGVYAAGDSTNLFKIVPAAIFSGAAAGAGLSRALGPAIVRERFGLA